MSIFTSYLYLDGSTKISQMYNYCPTHNSAWSFGAPLSTKLRVNGADWIRLNALSRFPDDDSNITSLEPLKPYLL
jgi:hypothetical protein